MDKGKKIIPADETPVPVWANPRSALGDGSGAVPRPLASSGGAVRPRGGGIHIVERDPEARQDEPDLPEHVLERRRKQPSFGSGSDEVAPSRRKRAKKTMQIVAVDTSHQPMLAVPNPAVDKGAIVELAHHMGNAATCVTRISRQVNSFQAQLDAKDKRIAQLESQLRGLKDSSKKGSKASIPEPQWKDPDREDAVIIDSLSSTISRNEADIKMLEGEIDRLQVQLMERPIALPQEVEAILVARLEAQKIELFNLFTAELKVVRAESLSTAYDAVVEAGKIQFPNSGVSWEELDKLRILGSL